MVEAAEVQRAVDGGLRQIVRVLRADDHVAQLARTGNRLGAVHGEREHVGGFVAVAVLAVELANPALADELDGDVAVVHPGRDQGQARGLTQVLRHVGQVERQLSSASARSAYWPYAATMRCTS